MAKVPRKLWAFLENPCGLLFFRSYNCGYFKKEPGESLQCLHPSYDPVAILIFFVIK